MQAMKRTSSKSAMVAALASMIVDARPKPGTTKHNEDLDGIGQDLQDFLNHRDRQQQRQRERENNNVYQSRNYGYGGIYGNYGNNGNYQSASRYNLDRSPSKPKTNSGSSSSKSVTSRITNFFKKIINS